MSIWTKLCISLSCILLFSQISFAECNIAVVDLQQVVSDSSQVKQLKCERDRKIDELSQIVKKAQCDIEKQSDLKVILDLQDKYTNEFNCKKNEIDKIYEDKIGAIECKIKNKIEEKAKCDGYDFVFAKSVALYGGKDITSEISCMINK